MQPKRILISLLVVILALLSAGTVVSAEDSTTLDMAVGVSSSTALSDNLCVVDDGDIVTVSVTIKSNPGIALMSFDIVYDSAYLAPKATTDGKVDWTSSNLFGSDVEETVVAKQVTINGKTANVVRYTVSASTNQTDVGTVFTCKFIATKHGNTKISLDMGANDSSYIEENGFWSEDGVPVTISYGIDPNATSLPVKIHTLGTPTSTPATCTEGGKDVYTCTACGETVSVSDGTSATGHTEVVIPSVSVSCTQDGLTEGKQCSVCGEVTKAQVVAVEKSDAYHTVVTDPAVAPTCTAAGKTEGSHCSSCNAVISAQSEVPALGHSYGDWVKGSDGVETRTCSTCGAVENGQSTGSNGSNTVWIVVISVVAGIAVGAAVVVVVFVVKKKKVV